MGQLGEHVFLTSWFIKIFTLVEFFCWYYSGYMGWGHSENIFALFIELISFNISGKVDSFKLTRVILKLSN